MCQRIKNRIKALAEKLKLSKILQKLWTYLMVDFITKLLLAAEKDAILVVSNRLSKMAHFVATTEEILVEGLARLFRDNVWKSYRLPESIVLDRGSQFAAELTRELNKMLEIKTKILTSFHLQTDGQIERINQELEQYLQFFVDHRQNNWPEWLVIAELTVNNKTHSVTKISPFIANYGRELRMGVNIRRKGKIKKITELIERIKKVQKKAEVVLRKT